MGTVFLQRQHLVQKSEVDNLRSGYGWYYDLLSGKIRNRWIIGAGTLALTILTGGLALHFAPAIAVALVGNTALHGAALTSFSLAAIGGGSLAVGGLGMAGGTLIIAGGGGVVGLLSGATLTSVTSMLLLESDGYVLNECSKLLGFSEKVLLKEENAYSKITELARTISVKTEYLKQLCRTLKRDMDSIKEQKEKQKQEQKVKVAEKSIGYLIETSKHLYELANRIPKEKR
jgi:gas vesicle protein